MDLEVNPYSPIRLLERAGSPALGPGEMGLVMGSKGVGKTSCLVQIAIDHMLHGRSVAHVSLEQPVGRVRDWYDECLKELEEAWSALTVDAAAHLAFERRRHIFSYHHHPFTGEHLGQQLRLVAEHQAFKPDVIIVDGFEFDTSHEAALAGIKEVARHLEAALWMSATATQFQYVPAPGEVPEPCGRVADQIDTLLFIETAGQGPHLRLVMHGHAAVKQLDELRTPLDPKTLLVEPHK